MKIRTDFVSNSSSSSFILKDIGFFAYFGITKQDINDAIIDLYGGKEYCDKLLKDNIDKCKKQLNDAEKNINIDAESQKWNIEYYTRRLNELTTIGLNLWCIYDMTDNNDRKCCFKEWDDHFAEWYAPNEGEHNKWEKLLHILRWDCDIDNIEEVANGKDSILYASTYSKTDKKHFQTMLSGGVELIRYIKNKLQVQTMKDVLHDEECTLMIHFDDNEIYSIRGMEEEGKADEHKNSNSSTIAQCKESKWDSMSYSADRFFEILIKYFVEKGKINLSDPNFLEYWAVKDNDDWYKKTYPNKKYYLDSNNTATWKEVVDDMLNYNAVMHEG